MPTPFELLRVADLIKLAADTAEECSKMSEGADMARVRDVCLRIKSDAEELQALGEDMDRKRSQRGN